MFSSPKWRPVILSALTIQAVLLILICSFFTNSLTNLQRVIGFELHRKQFERVSTDFNLFQNLQNETRNETRVNDLLINRTDQNYSEAIGINIFPDLKAKFHIPRMQNSKIPRIITQGHYKIFIRLLNLTTRVLEENDIEYSMAYGTLIGSYLMHDMIPWDDDMDIFVHDKSKAKVMELFKDARHHGIRGYYHYKHPGKLFKIFFNTSKSAGGYPWNWPFIDIVSYVEKGSQLKAVQRGRKLAWSKDSWYPLHLRPFGPLWLPAPRRPWVFLTIKYGCFKCKSAGWGHQRERGKQAKEADCSSLTKQYPFVKRSQMGNMTMETLMLDGKELYHVSINESYHPQKTLFNWW